MITREEKNKKVIQELNHEKTIKFSKIMLKITFIVAILFVGLYLYMRFIGTSDIKLMNLSLRIVIFHHHSMVQK